MASYKYSRQREIILNHLMSRRDHPTAEMIYTSLKENDPKLSLGTVYRNLGLLVQLGQIERVPTDSGPDRYDGNTARHGHFVCRLCSGIWDFSAQGLTESLERDMALDGRKPERIDITVKGICPACAQRASSAADPQS